MVNYVLSWDKAMKKAGRPNVSKAKRKTSPTPRTRKNKLISASTQTKSHKNQQQIPHEEDCDNREGYREGFIKGWNDGVKFGLKMRDDNRKTKDKARNSKHKSRKSSANSKSKPSTKKKEPKASPAEIDPVGKNFDLTIDELMDVPTFDVSTNGQRDLQTPPGFAETEMSEKKPLGEKKPLIPMGAFEAAPLWKKEDFKKLGHFKDLYDFPQKKRYIVNKEEILAEEEKVKTEMELQRQKQEFLSLRHAEDIEPEYEFDQMSNYSGASSADGNFSDEDGEVKPNIKEGGEKKKDVKKTPPSDDEMSLCASPIG